MTLTPTQRRNDPKEDALRRHGTLHPHPERVKDEAFRTHAFFDRRDLAQVRYEMLRRHRKDEVPVAKVARDFGVTRPTYYETEAAYEASGVVGLVPRKRGPKGPRRCTPEILDYVEAERAESPDVRLTDALDRVEERFGVRLHRRTLERGLAKRAKGGRGT